MVAFCSTISILIINYIVICVIPTLNNVYLANKSNIATTTIAISMVAFCSTISILIINCIVIYIIPTLINV